MGANTMNLFDSDIIVSPSDIAPRKAGASGIRGLDLKRNDRIRQRKQLSVIRRKQKSNTQHTRPLTPLMLALWRHRGNRLHQGSKYRKETAAQHTHCFLKARWWAGDLQTEDGRAPEGCNLCVELSSRLAEHQTVTDGNTVPITAEWLDKQRSLFLNTSTCAGFVKYAQTLLTPTKTDFMSKTVRQYVQYITNRGDEMEAEAKELERAETELNADFIAEQEAEREQWRSGSAEQKLMTMIEEGCVSEDAVRERKADSLLFHLGLSHKTAVKVLGTASKV